ncbi:MAG TPA: hypothetical protein ENK57_08930 [Polyangiaceae bacterium]|nr:hypothetical protein [Polyangiaceae bacterium]
MKLSTMVFPALIALAGVSLGCSEAVPPANQGAVSAQFITASAVGTPGSCTLAAHPFQIGVTHPSDTGQIIFLRDGEAQAKIFCSVVPDGNGWNVAAELEEGPRSFKVTVNGISASSTQAEPATGGVTYRSVETIDFFTSTEEFPCNFWITDQQQVNDGRVWMQYSCPLIQSKGRDCALGESTIVLQNCDS